MPMIPFLSSKGETELYKILVDHISKSLESIDELLKIISGEGDLSIIEENEKECDKLAYKATRLVVEGALPIIALNNLIKMIDDVDAIADKILFLAREITRYRSFIGDIEIEITKGLHENAQHTVEILKNLKQLMIAAAEGSKYDELLRLRDIIEEEEEKGDEYKDAVLTQLYKTHHEVSGREFIILRQLILTMDDIEDLSEDIANQLVIVKSLMNL